MTSIELYGRVNEHGEIEFEQPANLPPGDVRITIEPIDEQVIAADEVLWEEQFARSQDLLEQLTDEALAEYVAGNTDVFDPDNDPDATDL